MLELVGIVLGRGLLEATVVTAQGPVEASLVTVEVGAEEGEGGRGVQDGGLSHPRGSHGEGAAGAPAEGRCPFSSKEH
jgi:hypothetical protein